MERTAPRALVANARTLARARVPSIGGVLAVRLARLSKSRSRRVASSRARVRDAPAPANERVMAFV
jgi:hypothetical protein